MKFMLRSVDVCAAMICAAGCVMMSAQAFAGDLTPPAGPVAPTMKTLDQVEPRIPINSSTTPGDATATFVIVEAGSYYLEENLKGVTGRDGIRVQASNVTIDLRGFHLSGNATTMDGIRATSVSGLTVFNGSITDWGGDGIDADAAANCRISDVTVTGNGSGAAGDDGIVVGTGSIVSNCISNNNSTQGFDLGNHSILRDSIMNFNGIAGVQCSPNCAIINCTARGNPTNGIRGSENTTITGCAVERNGQGISSNSGSVITDCSSGENTSSGFQIGIGDGVVITNCTAWSNGSRGFDVGSNATVTNCTAFENFGEGFFITSDSTFTNCTSIQNSNNGIECTSGSSTFRNCTVRFNTDVGMLLAANCVVIDCQVSANTNGGIQVGEDCRVVGNACDGAFGAAAYGIQVTGTDTHVEGNTVTDNAVGIDVNAAGNVIIRNTASGNTVSQYDIVAGNAVGAVLSVGGSTITSSNPWANLSF